MKRWRIVILGLSITSSWGNGHATTYRALVRALAGRGHRVLFLERDVPWYRAHRDLLQPPWGETRLYSDLTALREDYAEAVAQADLVIVGSFVPDGIAVGEWATAIAGGVCAFYDIDTPVTLAALARGDATYLSPELVPRYDLYLSFTGGPILRHIEQQLGSPLARALYCAVDPEVYRPEPGPREWDLGYLGTYAADRQDTLEQLLIEPARRWPAGRFVVAGASYPDSVPWPDNVRRLDHLPPHAHRAFYNRQRFTLNVTRVDMVRAGWSPSVRLFEAAACGVPIISDAWPGLDEVFDIGREMLVAHSAGEVGHILRELAPAEADRIGALARERVLREHTAEHRVAQLEDYVRAARRGARLPPGAITALTTAGRF